MNQGTVLPSGEWLPATTKLIIIINLSDNKLLRPSREPFHLSHNWRVLYGPKKTRQHRTGDSP
jgi:hypothetical protein